MSLSAGTIKIAGEVSERLVSVVSPKNAAKVLSDSTGLTRFTKWKNRVQPLV